MKIFDSVAQMKLASLQAGQLVETSGYYTPGDGGQARYLIEAGNSPDGFGDHLLANGNQATLQHTGVVNVRQIGLRADGTTDDAAQWSGFVGATSSTYTLDFAGNTVAVNNVSITVDRNYTCSFGTGGVKMLSKDDDGNGPFEFVAGTSDNCTLSDFVFDGNLQENVFRAIRVRQNVKSPTIRGLTIKDFNARFVRAIDVDDDNVSDFLIQDIKGFNLTAPANAIVGDLDGLCRLIQINNTVTPITTSPSWGLITNILVNGLHTREDADAINIQSDSLQHSNIVVSNVVVKDCDKRAVKVQAHGVKVVNVTYDTRGKTDGLNGYAAVSAYGGGVQVSGVFAYGDVEHAVDVFTNLEPVIISDVHNIRDTPVNASVSTDVVRVAGGAAVISNVYGSNVDNLVYVRPSGSYILEDDVKFVHMTGLRGDCTDAIVKVLLFTGTAHNVDEITIDDVVATTTYDADPAMDVIPEAGATGQIGNVNIRDVKITGPGTYFTGLRISQVTGDVSIRDLEVSGVTTSAAQLVSITAPRIDGIRCRGAAIQQALVMDQCTKAMVRNLDGNGTQTLRVTNCDDVILDGSVLPLGATHVSNPSSTNVQSFNLVNFQV